MALGTLGTDTTSILGGLAFTRQLSATNIALMQLAIKNDQINGNPIFPGAFANTGLLCIPNRGVLQCLPGDVIGVDATGWPILLSANSINVGTDWTFTP